MEVRWEPDSDYGSYESSDQESSSEYDDHRFDDCLLNQPMPPYERDSDDELESNEVGSVGSSGRSGESDVSRADSAEIARMHEWDHMFMENRSVGEDEEVAYHEYDVESVEESVEEEEYAESSPVEECDAYDDQY